MGTVADQQLVGEGTEEASQQQVQEFTVVPKERRASRSKLQYDSFTE